jgi:hypothetical protein
MEYLIGFLIALFIALTGVGAGTLTVPVLVLFLNVPEPIAVGIGLAFSAIVKLILVPVQISQGNVAWRTLATMPLGGGAGSAPGCDSAAKPDGRRRRECGWGNPWRGFGGYRDLADPLFFPVAGNKDEKMQQKPAAGCSHVSRAC